MTIGLQAEGIFNSGYAVKELPAEELDYLVLALDLNGFPIRFASHVTVCRSGRIYRILEAEFPDYRKGPEVEQLRYLLCNLGIGETLAGAVGIDENTHGLSHAYCVCKLDKAFVGNAGGNEVLGYVTGGISGAAVYL